jgi:aminoglycoside phosphotransferase family enzyme
VSALDEPTLADKVRFLSDGAHLGEPGVDIQCIETHFAWVFLTTRYACKLRKPVHQHGLDTLSLEARRARCLDELRLNQELAPGVYLDVLPLTLTADGSMAIGTDDRRGRVVDWVLRMRRLPDTRMFDRMICEGRWTTADLQALSAHLQAFYLRTPVLGYSGPAYCDRLRAEIRDNREELLAAAPWGIDAQRVSRIASLQAHWIDAHDKTLMQRADRGMIRDCHGDLKPEHVCFGPPVTVIDRLEFDANLRVLDPLEDICFLWLECARLGAPAAGEWLVRDYLAVDDGNAHLSLACYYMSQRSLTRAKVAAWRLTLPGAERQHWQGRVDDYLTRALDAIHQAGG